MNSIMVRWLVLGAIASSPFPSVAVTLNDGLDHVVSDNAYSGQEVFVEDTSGGTPTTLTVLPPAFLGTGQAPYTLTASGIHGGHAEVDFQGTLIDGSIDLIGHSCATISSGTVAYGPSHYQPSIRMTGRWANGEALSYLRISGGVLDNHIQAFHSSHVTISDGNFGFGLGDYTLDTWDSFVRVSGGWFGKTWRLAGDSNVIVRGGTIGSLTDSAIEVDSSRLEIHNGSIQGRIILNSGSHANLSGGSFAADGLGRSLWTFSHSTPITVTHVSGGSFTGGVVTSSSSKLRITGGSFGQVLSTYSVDAAGADSIIEIFGGSFTGGIRAEQGTVHIFGQGLQNTGNAIIGTLGDGTPINAPAFEGSSGQIVLHEVEPEVPVVSGSLTLASTRDVLLALPHSLLLSPGCHDPLNNDTLVAMDALSLETLTSGRDTIDPGRANMAFSRLSDAVAPPLGENEQAIPIEMVALQLVSSAPVALASGSNAYLHLTLQSDRGRHALDPPPGPASSGDLTIRFGTRTSDVALEVFYDIREGSLDGPILHSDSDTIQTTAPVPWSATPPEGALEIPGHSEGFYFAAGGQGFGVHLEGTNMEWTAVSEESVVVPTFSAWAVAVLGLELGALGVLMIRRSRHQDAR